MSPRPRCGKWMPVAEAYCGLPEGHNDRCRTPAAWQKFQDRTTANMMKKRAERQLWLDAYKRGRGCDRCGYHEFPRALDFDHLDPASKAGNISRLLPYASTEELLAEMEKCQLLCSNCHRIKTNYPEQFAQPPAHFYERKKPLASNDADEGLSPRLRDHLPGRRSATVHSDHLPR